MVQGRRRKRHEAPESHSPVKHEFIVDIQAEQGVRGCAGQVRQGHARQMAECGAGGWRRQDGGGCEEALRGAGKRRGRDSYKRCRQQQQQHQGRFQPRWQQPWAEAKVPEEPVIAVLVQDSSTASLLPLPVFQPEASTTLSTLLDTHDPMVIVIRSCS
uniref:Uncharacterized protein n=1 Tax=Triticum urartu TaxID=4572 RepID=A0A8R7QXT2_TRIUA